MMSITHLLEDFGQTQPAQGTLSFTSDHDELATFDQGYQAGWDDAVKAKAEERTHISANLATNMQDLSFTFNEALGAMSQTSHKVIEEIVATILPDLAMASLAQSIIGQLQEMAENSHEHLAVISVSPNDQERLKSLISANTALPLEMSVDPTLSDGQVQISIGQRERQIDITEVQDGIAQAISGYFHELNKETQYVSA